MISIKMPNPDKLFDGLDKRSMALVRVRAQNKLAAKAKTLAGRAARERYTVKADALRSAMYIRKAYIGNESAELVVTGRRIPLSKFQISPRTPNARTQRRLTGTRVRELRKSPLEPRARLFTARMPSGHVGVFWRHPTKRLRENAKKAAIFEPSGPDAPGMVNNHDVMGKLRALVHDESEVIYKRELDYEMGSATATVRIE